MFWILNPNAKFSLLNLVEKIDNTNLNHYNDNNCSLR